LCRVTGDGKLLFSSRRAEVRWAAVLSSRGIGFPSATDGTREATEVLFDWKSRGKEKGRWDLLGARGSC
jgi:hypothetical protein